MLLGCAVLPAQEPPPPDDGAILARLRAPDLTLPEATTLVPLLQASPVSVRLQAIDALVAAYRERDKQQAKACERVQKDLLKVAPRVQKQRLGKQGAAKVDGLRAQALAISQRDGLTKELIHDQIDPLVDELTALLWPGDDELHAADATLAPALARLRQDRADLAEWHALYVAAAAGLELHPTAQKHFAKMPPLPSPRPAASLDDELLAWTLLALPLSARDRRALEDNELLRATADAEELAGTTALNRLRHLLGLALLRVDDRLGRAARDHSTDMVTLDFFAHESPVQGKRTPGDRAARFGTSGGAENIAQGHATGADAIRGWWYSPGHHRNMLGAHGRTGLGRCEQVWTQMFGG